jgi:hypothetical protein
MKGGTMRGIAQGQYVRAVLANGIGAGLPVEDIKDDEMYRRGGVVVDYNRVNGTIIVLDQLGNKHECWPDFVEHVDPMTLADTLRDWVIHMQVTIGLNRASVVP